MAHESPHDVNDLIRLFNHAFGESENTLLQRGTDEPIYLPADTNNAKHRIQFAHGYFTSALHEISHWCIAGKKRRQLVDFGYWYQPDGRTLEQQQEFSQVEVKPQALEWVFSQAANIKFNLSLDNLGSDIDVATLELGRQQFADKVYDQVQSYLQNGFSARQNQFIQVLLNYYRQGQSLTPDMFKRDGL